MLAVRFARDRFRAESGVEFALRVKLLGTSVCARMTEIAVNFESTNLELFVLRPRFVERKLLSVI